MPLGGKEARHYAIDPSGRFVVVAEQASDRVGVFSRNTTSGELQATGKTYPANKASCVVFT
jgi:6-phosphogluconolactonase